ncbi:unnamed protein product [Acanthoscelides obtectus]|uniref:Uncharacterized protein n=2 Tax=Acanthoscelides obtectus TaxID=200917 RepID=A0A9P0L585_ACAOB|nr:unnamed protein product [Acanthoscelides obtectus]CAK1677974.1 hypothetical protein AOBTE_LOCUS31690 [Acanthoscelides obtectus]
MDPSLTTVGDDSVEEFFTPKVGGEGDGQQRGRIQKIQKRVPMSSALKFRAKAQYRETMKDTLEVALTQIQSKTKLAPKIHNCLVKSRSIAEITPTKSKAKGSRPVHVTPLKISTLGGDAVVEDTTIHATPRRPAAQTSTLPRKCDRRWVECRVQKRLLLKAWRKRRVDRDEAAKKAEGLKEQVSQLQLQVDVLKNLRNSESDKRKEALNECHNLKKNIESLQVENWQLKEELQNIRDALDNTQKNMALTKSDLKKRSEQINKIQDLLKRQKEEKLDLKCKISSQEQEIYMQNNIISRLEQAISTTAVNLQNTENNLRAKEQQFDEIRIKLQNERVRNSSLEEDIVSLQQQKMELESQSIILEEQLEDLEISLDRVKEINETMKGELYEVSLQLCEEQKKNWFNQTKDVAMLSLSTLHKVFDAVLHIYLGTSL